MLVKHLKTDNELMERLLEYLRGRGYQQDERIPPERTLADELGVSRNSLREVIKVLETMDVLEVRPGSGTYLRNVDSLAGPRTSVWIQLHKHETLELHTVREALDLKAVELIPPIHLKTVSDRLKKCIQDFDIDNCTERQFIEHDVEYHDIIRQACGNKTLCSICQDITYTIYDERVAIASDYDRRRESFAEHVVLADAFSTCNVPFIKQMLMAHYQSVNNWIADI